MANSLLELDEVQKDYRIRSFGRVIRTTKALNKLSLKVEKGQIFGFLGPNGAGKTTTIKCITGILKSDSGSIKIEGENIENNSFENKNKIGFLPEQIGLYGNLNCMETLSFYAGFYDLKAEVIEKRSSKLLKTLGLEKESKRPVGEFSLGMKKRLALAIALLHEPQILILDEPTSGLDPRGVKALRSVLRDLNKKGLTILLSSHVLSEVQEICTHIGIINNGKLIKQESIQKIREKVRKTSIKLSLRVKNFNKNNEEELIKKNGIDIIEKNDLGKHQQIILTLKEKLIPWVTNNLVKNDVQIFSIEPQDTSLEDVFMTETGGENED
ncbi:MAG: ABC transporter ATP-binding protein [Methanobacteriota archaeon]|uniref:ABC transporter ATP-binding protein n=1 Tax=Marine Group III euryarchaeote TaxID=2173149 RepID=A0A7J4GQS6_9ARCH|nr:MAG: ABC transporter ATP-binding protein [Euryarchaeota archaeon]HIF36996.1 ABC transporter ATP-binding protein [Marine Group III euryarchaeote]